MLKTMPRIPKWTFAVAAVIFLLAIGGVWYAVSDRSPSSLEALHVEPYRAELLSAEAGTPWAPAGKDAAGFAVAAENAKFTLRVNPDNGQFTVTDKSAGGFVWRSNPEKRALSGETVKGTLLSNLESPYVLEYFEEGRTQRLLTNALDPKVTKTVTVVDGGVQVLYDHTTQQIKFAVRYQLTPEGVRAAIPGASVVESGKAKIISIELLPFMGAAATAEEGYLFVPDGPGALIRFPLKHAAFGNGYSQPVYGYDPASSRPDPDEKREVIGYPVFGIKRGANAYAAIVTRGDKSAIIRANPSGIVSTFHSASASLIYREEYDQRTSLRGKPMKVFQRELRKQDFEVEYRLLSGSEASYTGMAHAYRNYLLQTKQLVDRVKPAEHVPLDLSLIGGGASKSFSGTSFVPVTTFRQAEAMVEELKDKGVAGLNVTYSDWERNGEYSDTLGFTIESKLGGSSGLHSFVDRMHELGASVYMVRNVNQGDSKYLDLSPKTYGIRGIDGTVLLNRGGFTLNPIQALRYEREASGKLKTYGVDGLILRGVGGFLYRDYNPERPMQRDDTAYYNRDMLANVRKTLGLAGVNTGFSYTLSEIDRIQNMPLSTSNDFLVDEAVPFYPIVLHGYVAYSTVPGNFRNLFDDEMLRAIEYGANPAYTLTHDSSRKLLGTAMEWLSSSEFAVWKDTVVKEYAAFDQLAPVYDQEITGHEKVSDGVFVTSYANGVQVRVDYNRKTFDVSQPTGGAKGGS